MDIIELLSEHDVRVWRFGKNVSRGWIGLNCPFCDDNYNHLGIHLKTLRCKCWKCGQKKLSTVLKEVLYVDINTAIELAKKLDPSEISENDEELYSLDESKISIKLPPESTKRFPEMHYQYLRTRGFPVLKTIREYRLRAVEHIGPFKFRIIIPIIYQNRIITFTSRDVTDKAQLRYKAAPSNLYPNPKHFIYNADSVPNGARTAVLVEGPTDVWKLGAGAISLFGIQTHGKQLVHLARKNIKRLHILFDNDEPGYRAAGVLSKIIRSIVGEINIVSLTEVSDPGNLTREQGEIIMRTLGIRK